MEVLNLVEVGVVENQPKNYCINYTEALHIHFRKGDLAGAGGCWWAN